MGDAGPLMGVRVLDQMPEVAFFPTSATEFTTFSLRQPMGVKLKFAMDEKGATNVVTIAGEGGEIGARKTK